MCRFFKNYNKNIFLIKKKELVMIIHYLIISHHICMIHLLCLQINTLSPLILVLVL